MVPERDGPGQLRNGPKTAPKPPQSCFPNASPMSQTAQKVPQRLITATPTPSKLPFWGARRCSPFCGLKVNGDLLFVETKCEVDH